MPNLQYNLLCIDDDLGFRRYLRSSLQDNYQIQFCSLGIEFLNKHLNSAYDLILIDATLPDMSPEQLIQRIRNHPELIQTPIVIVSYKNSEQECRRFLQRGCDYFLSKVASPSEVQTLLDSLVNQAA